MKCLLLAAGLGSRLGELTKNKPKPLIDLNGRPLIEHTISRLAAHGIVDVIVNIHYLPEMMVSSLRERVLYYHEPKLLGHKKTIFALRNWLQGEDFMVVNADTITDLDYTTLIATHNSLTSGYPHGHVTAVMDEYQATGTWVYSKEVFENNIPIIPYRVPNLYWEDLGTPERLEKTRKRLAEEL